MLPGGEAAVRLPLAYLLDSRPALHSPCTFD
jgi:hypothetical protein